MKVECIDDAGKPEDIPTSCWIKKGVVYTVIQVIKINMTGDWAVRLAEVDTGTPLYAGYNVKRFKPVADVPVEELVTEKELVA